MNDTRARELFIDSLKEPLPPADAAALATHLETKPLLRAELEQLRQVFCALAADAAETPSASAYEALEAAIAAEETAGRGGPEGPRVRGSEDLRVRGAGGRPWGWLGLAGGVALLALGFAAGLRVGQARIQPVGTPRITIGLAEVDPASARPATVRSEEPQEEFVDLDQPAGPVRVEQVLRITDAASVRRALEALATDPSANVRLTVLGALDPRTANQNVRATVLASVSRDPSPIVQIAMIEFISAAGGPEAVPTLTKLARNETIDESVRDAATYALAQL